MWPSYLETVLLGTSMRQPTPEWCYVVGCIAISDSGHNNRSNLSKTRCVTVWSVLPNVNDFHLMRMKAPYSMHSGSTATFSYFCLFPATTTYFRCFVFRQQTHRKKGVSTRLKSWSIRYTKTRRREGLGGGPPGHNKDGEGTPEGKWDCKVN